MKSCHNRTVADYARANESYSSEAIKLTGGLNSVMDLENKAKDTTDITQEQS